MPTKPESPEELRLNKLEDRMDKTTRIMGGMDEKMNSIMRGMDTVANAVTQLTQRQASLEQRAARTDAPQGGGPLAPAPEDLVFHLPEGVTRFMSPTTNYQIVRPGWTTVDETGERIYHKERILQFQNGIYDADEDDADFLKSLKFLGEDYFEDPTAQPVSRVKVADGPRGSAGAPARVKPPIAAQSAPLSAPIPK